MLFDRAYSVARTTAIAFALVALAGCAAFSGGDASASRSSGWAATWATSAAVPAANGPAFNNQTLRLITHVSLGGDQLRVRVANTFGAKPLSIGAAAVALQSTEAAIVASSSRALTFGGKSSVSIPPGALIVSDPVALQVAAQSNVAVSLYLNAETGPATAHPGANQNSYVSGSGNFVTSAEAKPFATTIPSWPYLAGIEVATTKRVPTVVAFGDSITDGFKSTIDANRRWPDYFMARMMISGRNVAVVNAGISGNRLLHDSMAGQPRFGPNALSRFDRDALTVTGATHLVTLIGINDIGMGSPSRAPQEVVSAEQIIAAHQQLLLRAKAQGLKVFGATFLPFRGAQYFTEEGEQKRLAVNKWIRENKDYDGVLDFDKATQDPAKPSQLLTAYDSGDHLHPNDAGYKAMADSIDLALFE